MTLAQLIQREMKQLLEDWEEAAPDTNGEYGRHPLTQDLPIVHAAQELRRRVIRALGVKQQGLPEKDIDELLRFNEAIERLITSLGPGCTSRKDQKTRLTETILKASLDPAASFNRAGIQQVDVCESRSLRRKFDHLRLSRELDDALREDQLEVYYQPIIDISTGAISRAEALLRWNHPYKGLLTPADFLGIAEQNGMANCITLDVLEQAVTCSHRWRDPSDKAFPININESPAWFVTRSPADQWRARLTEIGLDKSKITLELTPASLNNIHASGFNPVRSFGLAGLGLRLAVDNFGIEPFSLSALREFRMDTVKIDRELIRNAGQGGDADRTVEGIIAMAHAIDVQVIAMGVENDGQVQFLSRAGCDYAQGFLFSGPLPPKDFEALLREDRQKETA